MTNPSPGNWREYPKTENKNKYRDNNRDSDDRLRDLREWLEEFTENLQDTDVPAPHTFLMTQIRNVLRKWHSGSTVFTLTSHKIEIGKYACEPR